MRKGRKRGREERQDRERKWKEKKTTTMAADVGFSTISKFSTTKAKKE